MEGKFTKAKYGEWQASLFGACGIALGVGILLAPYIHSWALWLVIIGAVLHAWGMYRIRNQK
ncbi:MAG: hypothetical protein JNN11_03385 [Candidatus Doudnabacteria bacterium]|nr:hypothetical protein [Candidatus Doudnabacteria bacterium]